MKKIFIFIALMTFTLPLFSLNSGKGVIDKVLKDYVNEKVDFYQEIIKFNDERARELKKIELQYLLDVKKAEECLLCQTQKRIKKLNMKKYRAVEKLLSRDEFVKYKALENQEVRKRPEWASNKKAIDRSLFYLS